MDNLPPKKGIFYIVKREGTDPDQEIKDMVYELKNRTFLSVIQDATGNYLLSNDMGYSAYLQVVSESIPAALDQFKIVIKLTIDLENIATFDAIKKFIWFSKNHYSIFSTNYNCFLPRHPEIRNTDIGSTDKMKAGAAILFKYGLVPVYFSQEYGNIYAVNIEKQVFIINTVLLNFMVDKKIADTNVPDLSYKVADSLVDFTLFYNYRLIPLAFYQYYKRNLRVINDSFFDIFTPKQKIFFKPLIFKLQDDLDDVYTIAGENSNSLLAMDKIRPGETLEIAIKRHVRDELKIADDFIRAYVEKYVEYDRDREGIITPRLVVCVFLREVHDMKAVEQQAQTSWRSMPGR